MRLIPAIDLIDGKCVRLTKGDYSTQKTYNENPVEVAKEFQDYGIKYLHLVDLDGAKTSDVVNLKTLEKIANQTDLKIDFGGGIKSNHAIESVFNAGANQITGGSIAVKDSELFASWIQKYGANKIILGADCINRKIATQGWLDTSEMEVIEFIKNYALQSIEYVICTDIAKDGMLQGTSNELYEEILSEVKIKLIASGGVSNLDDLYKVQEIGCEGVIIGKAIYEGRIMLSELRDF